jgi:2-keto-4-pentenoate hydratase/2-oxohepta-3-ene-1,7-dioic acid hydratase in catechol pathway
LGCVIAFTGSSAKIDPFGPDANNPAKAGRQDYIGKPHRDTPAMRIVRFSDDNGKLLWGKCLGDGSADLLAQSPLDNPPETTGRKVPIYRLLTPIEPTNVFCIGKNYREHAAEMDSEVPPRPIIFMKPTSALNHPDSPIRLPACSHGPEVDYEGELAVVIGKAGRDIPKNKALEHVLGYTCANDVSARWWQKKGSGGQWVRGKGFDSFCPLGPCLVTADEVPDPQALTLTTTLNGEVVQRGHTKDMIFPVAELIAFLSQDTTLLAGTVILTGTPAGVGAGRTPPVFLKPGDEVTIEIEKLGKLTNQVVAAGHG